MRHHAKLQTVTKKRFMYYGSNVLKAEIQNTFQVDVSNMRPHAKLEAVAKQVYIYIYA